MDATTQKVARQQLTPFGGPRASANSTPWVDSTRGYLDKPQDAATGYTDMGARKYDPVLGRFISDDPVLETTSPQQLGGYTYAADNPTTGSDPSGLRVEGPDGCNGTASEVDACEGQVEQQTQQSAPAAPAAPATAGTSWTSTHWMAQLILWSWLEARAIGTYGPTGGWRVQMETPIVGASKEGTGNDGYADMTYLDGNTMYVWELKNKAVMPWTGNNPPAEASGSIDVEWYIDAMQHDPKYSKYNIVPGFPLPYPLVGPGYKKGQFLELDNSDWYPSGSGVITYTAFYLPTSRRVPMTAPQGDPVPAPNSVAQRVPAPSPGAAPVAPTGPSTGCDGCTSGLTWQFPQVNWGTAQSTVVGGLLFLVGLAHAAVDPAGD